MKQPIRLSDHFTYRRLLRFVLPTVVMMVFTSIYSIVDGFFVSNLVGKNAFAAVNLIMPFLMALGAFGFMIGTGGSALVAKQLGEGRTEEANQSFSMLMIVTLVAGLALGVLGFALMRPVSLWLGASEAILEDCVVYGRIIVLATAFFMVQNCFQSFLVVAEKPSFGLTITVLSGVSNMVLDYLFIAVLHMGIVGAALATALSQFIGGIIPLVYFIRPNKSLLRLTRAPFRWSVLKKASLNGSSEMMSNLSSSIVGMLYNWQLIRFAAENGIASYGVIMYVTFIFNGLFFGYAIGSAPLVSYHYGAQNTDELRNLYRKSLALMFGSSVLLTVLGQVLAAPLAGLFVGYDAELHAMTTHGLRLYSLSFLMTGFNIFGSSFFTALNNGGISALISFLRSIAFELLALIVLPMFFALDGVWLAIVATEGATLILTAALLFANRKRYRYGATVG